MSVEPLTVDDEDRAGRAALIHQFKNQLAIIAGFCDLLLRELPETDPARADIGTMRQAAGTALALLPQLARSLMRRDD